MAAFSTTRLGVVLQLPRVDTVDWMPVSLSSPRRALASGLLAGACLLAPAGAHAAQSAPRTYVPGEVVVRYAPEADRTARAAAQRGTGTGAPQAFAPRERVLKIRDGDSVAATVAQLRRRRGVLSATPNYIAHASGYVPNDPGDGSGWQNLQWNFNAGTGVNAPDAWERMNAVGRPGGLGVKVAVLDTGVAYASRRGFKRSPDLAGNRFLKGYDFVDNDAYPDDQNGHGTHVASTIAETTGNGYGVTGLAYGARLMPVRVLDRFGAGDSVAISAGIRYASRRGAKVINLSFEFCDGSDPQCPAVTASDVPDVIDAVHYARTRGVIVVAAAGNTSNQRAVAYPARVSPVLSVGATTEYGCEASYSSGGAGLDLVAPGGGPDANLPGDPNCQNGRTGRDVFQVTFKSGSVRSFGLPSDYEGTSMASPHVAATAALIIASGVIGPNPTPAAIEARLKGTARDLGAPGRDAHYGNGLIDAARAVTP